MRCYFRESFRVFMDALKQIPKSDEMNGFKEANDHKKIKVAWMHAPREV